MKMKQLVFAMTALSMSAASVGHGLISEPPSRNWLCGATTKPHEAAPTSACGQAFAADMNGGYQFMSVLTHDVGRKGVTPLPTNVCGFDSETWNGGATPWDQAIDWPTNNFTAGPKTITWDISWGPHYDDTEEFRYWITKPDFQFQVGQALTWNDFETEAFCVINYDDKNPAANPDAIPDKGNALFHTVCDIPQRSGRHVIYAEWGRNQWTYERFHGCIDASFGGGAEPDPVVAAISATPSDSSFIGAGSVELSAAGSIGTNLSYQWSIDSINPSLYSLSSPGAATTTLSLANPQAESAVTIRLLVSSGGSISNAAFTITHSPEAGGSWVDLGALNTESRQLDVGDKVNLRLVRENGQDVYLPATPVNITAANQEAAVWTYALAQAVNDVGGDVQVGVLDASDNVNAIQSATANRIYAQIPSDYANVYLNLQYAASSSSVASSSSASAEGQQCNWYGSLHPLCETTATGWGWENNSSCVASSTCADQPPPYGIVGASQSSASSVESSSSSSSTATESSASSVSSSVPATGVNCEYIINDQWNTGFTATIRITNNGTDTINGWNIGWTYDDQSRVSNAWNADLSGNNPYSASNIGWNGLIDPGNSVEFGFQGTKSSGAASIPLVTGDVCGS